MTYELTYYIFLIVIGLLLCIKEIKSTSLYNIITFTLFFIFAAITRYSGFDIDINTYAKSLHYIDNFSAYYLREPVYWISSRYIYLITQSYETTFLFYDSIAIILILYARKNFSFPQYFPYLFFLFFPSVMGLNNVYRQYLTYVLFIFFLSITLTKPSSLIKRSLFSLIVILTHNVAALFIPIFFINRKIPSKYRIIRIILYIGILIGLPIALATKSNVNTGYVDSELYIFAIFCFLIFILISHKFLLRHKDVILYTFFVYSLILLIMSIDLVGSAQSKRIGMFILILLLIPLTKVVDTHFKQKNIARSIIYIILVMPTLIFSSSRMMLLT
ncbi:hypothetical protein B9T19_04965 [Ignatzschineria sp. F8392]|uniref:EpsG family protein n=1 Tax=Ignatzschineria sp. F8392 TaxID=1980117 RepID=UPI000B99C5D5|nr:hypothetical protein B9T19_04965 [Ignatzschineria sp. F8392]